MIHVPMLPLLIGVGLLPSLACLSLLHNHLIGVSNWLVLLVLLCLGLACFGGTLMFVRVGTRLSRLNILGMTWLFSRQKSQRMMTMMIDRTPPKQDIGLFIENLFRVPGANDFLEMVITQAQFDNLLELGWVDGGSKSFRAGRISFPSGEVYVRVRGGVPSAVEEG